MEIILNVGKLAPIERLKQRNVIARERSVTILPLILVVEGRHAARITEEEVLKDFQRQMADLASRATLIQYVVDEEPYYRAFWGGDDTQMTPICIVKAWY